MFIVKYDYDDGNGSTAKGLEEEIDTLTEAQALKEDLRANFEYSNIEIIPVIEEDANEEIPTTKTKVEMFCNQCKITCLHDHIECIDDTEEIITTVNVCLTCGYVDVDCDSIDTWSDMLDDGQEYEYCEECGAYPCMCEAGCITDRE